MFAWLFTSPSERRLLGSRPLKGPTPWVIAIMTFAIMIVAAAGLALADTAARVAAGAEARFSLQIPNGERSLGAVIQVVRSTAGVTNAEAVPENEMRRTLERWLGPAGASADLPVPALITFDAQPRADLRSLEWRAEAVAPGAKLVAHRDVLGPLLRSLESLQWVALALVILLGTACAAAVVLAARGALDTHRFTIDVMHGIGATDIQVTHLFERKIAIDALAGSMIGATAAAVVLGLLAAGSSFAGDLMGGATLGTADLLILAGIPLGLTLLATWVARTAVLASLRTDL
jgi:cell division transport system permease protein